MKLPFIKCNYPTNDKFMGELKRLLETGPWSNNGVYHQLFEKELEKLLNTNVALVDHGQSAVLLMLAALGIKNKYIIVPSYTFVGTVAAVIWSGNKPIFCDVKSTTYPLLDTNKCQELLEEDGSGQIGAILGVDLYGLPCNYKELNNISKNYKVPVIIDSAQAFGTKLNNRLVGNNCLMHAFSFHTTKTFPTLEGGMVTSDDEHLIEKIKKLRNFGINPVSAPDCTEIGLNCKMNEVQALVGLYMLENIQETFNLKRIMFSEYISLLRSKNITTLTIPKHCNPISNIMPIFMNERNLIQKVLKDNEVESLPYWKLPVHRMTAYRKYYDDEDLFVTDKVSKKALALPFYNHMDYKEMSFIVDKIKGAI